MTTRRTFVTALLSALLALTLFPPAPAQAQDKELDALQARFKERDGAVRKLKSAGVVGETSDGLLDYVEKRDADAAKVVDAENADRRKLYALIAEKENVTPEVVAQRNAKRNFERARAGEFLKEDGKWRKKG